MNIPSLPTDSLYKFAAIGSLAAWGFVVAFGWSQYTQVQQLIYENQEAVAVLEAEVDFATLKKGFTSDESALEAKKNIARSKSKHSRIESLSNQSMWVLLVSLLGSAFCLFICQRSFKNWYVRVQRPQDELLQLQLKKAIADAPANAP